MSDFWAGYISGAVGICVGNPLDVVKVRLQSGRLASFTGTTQITGTAWLKGMLNVSFYYFSFIVESPSLIQPLFLRAGAAAPIVAYGALNSLLFVTYNRCLKLLDPSITDPTKLRHVNLDAIWIAGAIGGLATWVVSAPSELIKCRTQLHEGAAGKANSLRTFEHVWKRHGLRGLYLGGGITSVRDAVGYGFYFSSYELCRRAFAAGREIDDCDVGDIEVLVSGGMAGIVTWASIYPLDVIKTRIQAEAWKEGRTEGYQPSRDGTMTKAMRIWREDGLRAFYRGLIICSVRAFLVNAIQVLSIILLPLLTCSLLVSGILMSSLWHFSIPRTEPKTASTRRP